MRCASQNDMRFLISDLQLTRLVSSATHETTCQWDQIPSRWYNPQSAYLRRILDVHVLAIQRYIPYKDSRAVTFPSNTEAPCVKKETAFSCQPFANQRSSSMLGYASYSFVVVKREILGIFDRNRKLVIRGYYQLNCGRS